MYEYVWLCVLGLGSWVRVFEGPWRERVCVYLFPYVVARDFMVKKATSGHTHNKTFEGLLGSLRPLHVCARPRPMVLLSRLT